MPFTEHFIDADGFRVRYMEAGDGPPLVHLHGAGGLHLTPAHDLLARERRVIVFEMPGFGASADNTRSATMPDLANTMAVACRALGLGSYDLWGSSFGGKVALWLAVLHPDAVRTVVLEAPAAIRPEGSAPAPSSPEELRRQLFAYPDKAPPMPALAMPVAVRQQQLVGRLRGPDRDVALEDRLRGLPMPVLVLFGTLDHRIPPEMGRHYKTLIPNCHLIFVYDAGHLITVERPEAFTEVVSDFLTRLEGFVISQRVTMIHP